MPSITFGGLASGLDTNAIISALMKVEQQPILQLQAQQDQQNLRLDMLGTFESFVDKLRDKAKALSTIDDLSSSTVELSEEGIASVTVTGAPATGPHTLTVNSLAAADSWSFGPHASKTTDLLAADTTLSFTMNGTQHDVALTAADSTLEDIASAINEEAAGEVSASVVNVGTSASPSYKLVVTGLETGADNAIAWTAPPTELGTQTHLTTAANASITVDNLQVEREGNDFSDVLDGLDIKALKEGVQISFTVSVDTAGIKKKLQEFVDAYNNVIEFTNDQNKYDPEKQTPVLFGDTVLSRVKGDVQKALFGLSQTELDNLVSNPTGFDTLSIVGVKTNSDGTLEIDDSKLDDKLAEDVDQVIDLFTDSDGFDNGGITDEMESGYYVDSGTTDHGVLEKLWRAIDQLKDSKTGPDNKVYAGLFKAREDAINANLGQLDDRISALEEQLTQFEAGLVAKFSSLEKIMGGLNAQQAQMNQMLAAL